MLRNFVLITAGLGATAVNFHKKEHMMTVPADPAQAKTGAKATPAKKEGCSPAEDAKSVAAGTGDGAAGADANAAGSKATAKEKEGCSPAKDAKADGNAENAEAKSTPKAAAAAVHVAQQAHDIKTMMTKNGKAFGIGGLATLAVIIVLMIALRMKAASDAKKATTGNPKSGFHKEDAWGTSMNNSTYGLIWTCCGFGKGLCGWKAAGNVNGKE